MHGTINIKLTTKSHQTYKQIPNYIGEKNILIRSRILMSFRYAFFNELYW